MDVVLVTGDAHAGLKAAIKAILSAAARQRRRVHFARHVTRLLGAVLQEQHEEWQSGEGRYFPEAPMRELSHALHHPAEPASPELHLSA